jgi:hypothetical protein
VVNVVAFLRLGEKGVSEVDKKDILDKLQENPFVTLQQDFSSYYKIEKHVENSPSFGYIKPIEVMLPPNDEGVVSSFQLVPPSETIEAIVNDPDFRKSAPAAEGLLRDVKDGSAWHGNAYFQSNKDALAILWYSDAVELCNPLGAKKGVYKVVNIYFSLCDIDKHFRSKTDNFYLVAIVKESDLKSNRLAVYKPILDDLKKLEAGVLMGNAGLVKAGVLAHLTDNLEVSVSILHCKKYN